MKYNFDLNRFDGDWFHTREVSHDRSSKLFYFESGNQFGCRDDDGVLQYRINCSYWFGDWIETQPSDLWRSYGGRHRAIYIIREELMTIIQLRWL